jgi:hypothetical protein
VPRFTTHSSRKTIGPGWPSLLNKSQGAEPPHQYVFLGMNRLLAKLFDVMVRLRNSVRGQLGTVLAAPHDARIKAAAVHAVLRKRLYEAYDRLATEADVTGDERKARDWRLLASDCRTQPHDGSLAGMGSPEESDLRWNHPDVWQAISNSQLSSFQTRYAIWAFAVRNEVAVRDELTAVAAFAVDRKEKARALQSARKADKRAAKYRVMRRVAYHSEERRLGTITFPAVNRLQTLDDIGHVAGAIETWLAALLGSHTRLGDDIVEALQITRQANDICIMLTVAQTAHKRLQQGLRRIDAFVRTYEPGDVQPSQARGQIVTECERVFDYYDSLFEASEEPDTLKAAQVLSRLAVARLVALRNIAPVEHAEPPGGPSP